MRIEFDPAKSEKNREERNLPLIVPQTSTGRAEFTPRMSATKLADQVLPKELADALPKRGRPVSEKPKKAVNLRLSPEILSAFKSTGRGWQTRINDALLDWLKEHRP